MPSRVQEDFSGKNTVGCRLAMRLAVPVAEPVAGPKARAGETQERRTRNATAIHGTFRKNDLIGYSPDMDFRARHKKGLR